ncbi:hypothetical protein MTO96_047982 [Rhipicephalus appendiculatus]
MFSMDTVVRQLEPALPMQDTVAVSVPASGIWYTVPRDCDAPGPARDDDVGSGARKLLAVYVHDRLLSFLLDARVAHDVGCPGSAFGLGPPLDSCDPAERRRRSTPQVVYHVGSRGCSPYAVSGRSRFLERW